MAQNTGVFDLSNAHAHALVPLLTMALSDTTRPQFQRLLMSSPETAPQATELLYRWDELLSELTRAGRMGPVREQLDKASPRLAARLRSIDALSSDG